MSIRKINETKWIYAVPQPTTHVDIKVAAKGLMIGKTTLLWEDIEEARKAIPKPKPTPSVIITTDVDLMNLEPSMQYELGRFTMLRTATINIATTANGTHIRQFDSSFTYRKGEEIRITVVSPRHYDEEYMLSIVDETGCLLFMSAMRTIPKPDAEPEGSGMRIPKWLRRIQKHHSR